MLGCFGNFIESLWGKLVRRMLGGLRATPSSSPWDSWELDRDFFAAMSRWTIDHPETTLDRVLDKICVGIDHGKDLIELIPDSPFPARSLVKALGYLVQLGKSVSRANAEVLIFAKDVIQWMSEMQSEFGGQDGHISWRTKRNLRRMRVLIDEICKWATARLRDGRWSRITHGLTIAQEIEEFKSQIASARAVFLDLNVINLSHGLDSITREIRILRQLQYNQLKNIHDRLDSHMQAEARHQFFFHILNPRTVTNATYDEQGKQPCDPDTRTAILADIASWIHDFSEDSQNFLWLTGDPGSGKSAITASVARECKNSGVLWAQFFINRNSADTTDPRTYFPSIARQLAEHITDSDVALSIHAALTKKRALVDDISTEQASSLFVDAMEVASKLDLGKPVVIVIDGLDETSRPRLRLTAGILSELFAKLRCRNAKVFISSRTEDDIQKPFSKAFHVKYVKHIHLDTTAESSIWDVSNFLGRRIAEIVENNDLNWEEWPGKERMQALCFRASGLFIWATTVVKFFKEQIDMMGRECLNDLLDVLSMKGMGDINVLYGTILRLLYRGQTDEWVFETFRRIVGCIVVLQEPLCITEIENLLDLRQNASSPHVDVKHFIRRLRTVLVAGADAIDGHTIPRLHKSFFEFITGHSADSCFRIDMSLSHIQLTIQCLRQLVHWSNNNTATYSPYSPLPYALDFWFSHLHPDMMAGIAIADSLTLHRFQELFYASCQDQLSPIHLTLSSNRDIISTAGNVVRFTNANGGADVRFPLNCYTSTVHSVAFSPDGTKIVSGSPKNLRLWDSHSSMSIGMPLEGHGNKVAFSPDGQQILSGSRDGTLCLWHVQSGKPVGSPFKGHTDSVLCAAFSLNGNRIVSGSLDHTVRLWDAQSHEPLRTPYKGHHAAVCFVVFSPDGMWVISGSWDGTVRRWNAQNSSCLDSLILNAHTSTIQAVAFSPDGQQIVLGSQDHTLRLWDVRRGGPVGPPFKGHTDAVSSVAFSLDGKQIVSGSWDKTLQLWDAQSRQPIGSPFEGHSASVNSVVFAPDGKRIASGAGDNTLRLWDVTTHQQIELPITGHTSLVTSIAQSPDKRRIVSASLDNTIRMWYTQTGQPIRSPANIENVISLTFSPDGTQFASASLDGTICLWDAENNKSISSYHKDCINKLSMIMFSSDGKHLMTSSINGITHSWNATNGEPIDAPKSSHSSPWATNEGLTYTTKRGWCNEDSNKVLLRFYPLDNPDFPHCAYIGGKLIRRDKTGLTTIMDMSEIQHK